MTSAKVVRTAEIKIVLFRILAPLKVMFPERSLIPFKSYGLKFLEFGEKVTSHLYDLLRDV
jgi:hypothetical protein